VDNQKTLVRVYTHPLQYFSILTRLVHRDQQTCEENQSFCCGYCSDALDHGLLFAGSSVFLVNGKDAEHMDRLWSDVASV
jgi:hypothetical protein